METMVSLQTYISKSELASVISQLDEDDVIELIKQVDKYFALYNFTKKLRDYFVSEVDKEDSLFK